MLMKLTLLIAWCQRECESFFVSYNRDHMNHWKPFLKLLRNILNIFQLIVHIVEYFFLIMDQPVQSVEYFFSPLRCLGLGKALQIKRVVNIEHSYTYSALMLSKNLNSVHQAEYLDHLVKINLPRAVLVIHPERPP